MGYGWWDAGSNSLNEVNNWHVRLVDYLLITY
jgi:hypothetical protein